MQNTYSTFCLRINCSSLALSFYIILSHIYLQVAAVHRNFVWGSLATWYDPHAKKVRLLGHWPGNYLQPMCNVTTLMGSDDEGMTEEEFMDRLPKRKRRPKAFNLCNDESADTYRPMRSAELIKDQGRQVWECNWCGSRPVTGLRQKVKEHVFGVGTGPSTRNGCLTRRRVHREFFKNPANKGKQPEELGMSQVADVDEHGYLPPPTMVSLIK